MACHTFSRCFYAIIPLSVHGLTSHETGTQLLAGVLSPQDAELVNEKLVSLVLAYLRNISRYIIIDTPHDFSPSTLAALEAAHRIIIPITPDIISARLTVNALRVFDLLGFPKHKIEIIVNCIFAKDGLDKAAIEKFIGHPVTAMIPYSPEVCNKAINLGKPVIMNDEPSRLTALLESLIWHFSTGEDRARNDKNRTEMWLRVTKRRQVASIQAKGSA